MGRDLRIRGVVLFYPGVVAAAQLLANKQLADLHAGSDRPGDFASAVDHDPPGLAAMPAFAQPHGVLDPRVLHARDVM